MDLMIFQDWVAERRQLLERIKELVAENAKLRKRLGEVIRPKYELISSHTSRRSGATNLYKLGVLSNMEMRSITGHQSEKVFEKYIRVGLSEQAQIVGDKILAAKKAKKKKVDK